LIHMKIARMVNIILIALAITLSWRVIAFIAEGEEGRLKRTIYKMKRLVEKERAIALSSYISYGYSDEFGNDRRTLLLAAKRIFDECGNIVIVIDALDIEIEEGAPEDFSGRASIDATVYWQNEDSEDIIYDSAAVETRFIKKESVWMLESMDFKDAHDKQMFHPSTGKLYHDVKKARCRHV